MPFLYTDRGARYKRNIAGEKSEETNSFERAHEGLILRQVPRCEIIERGFSRRELRSDVQIFATSERLWQEIINNQKIISKDIGTTRKRHSNLNRISISLVGREGKISSARLTRFQLNSELGWKERRWFIPGFLQKESQFQIVPHIDRVGVTLFETRTFSGMLVPFLKSTIDNARTEIQLANVAIREKAENIN